MQHMPENSVTTAEMTNSLEMQQYALLKEEVLAGIVQMSALEHLVGFPLDELTEKIRTNTLNLVVVGQFKRGKTCFINALIGVDLLPTGVVPLTSIVTVLTYGETLQIQVAFQNGKVITIDPERLVEYVTEPGNPKNIKEVEKVFVSYPSPYLKDGVRLVDTPGVGSVYIHNTDVAYQYLPNSDAVLFLLSVEQPASKAELDFLKDVERYADKIFFLLNKIDYVTDREINESVAFAGRTIKEAAGIETKVYPISAKLALEGKLEGSQELLKQSKLPAFAEVLNTFLIEEKGSILLRSVINNLLRILSQARLQLELELQSLICPLDELQTKLQALEAKKEEILMEERNFDILLEGEMKRLIRMHLDEDLDAFKKEIVPQMEQGFDAFYDDHQDLSLKDLNDALEAYVVSHVEPAFNAWRMKEDDALARANQAICDRFAAKMNQIIDDLLEFSSQLFAVPFSSVKAESLWTGESNFSYKLKEEPVGLDMLTDSLTQVFPRYISNRFQKLRSYLFRKANSVILGKRKRHMLELIEMQAGRIRYDFIARLSDSKQKFHGEMIQKMRSTLEGIGKAMEKGMKQRAQGEKELLLRQSALSRELPEMDALRDNLLAIRENISRT
jgi:GTPase SAR1 family protein